MKISMKTVKYQVPDWVYSQITKKQHQSHRAFLLWLSHNRLLYWYSCLPNAKSGKWIRYRKIGEVYQKKFNQTIGFISKISAKNNLSYIIAKYDRNLPFIASDIDLLIRPEDLSRWVEIFRSSDFHIERHPEFIKSRPFQLTVRHKKYYKIDLTTQFCWQDSQYFSPAFLWYNSRLKRHQLSSEADFLVNLGNIIFKRMYLTILDYLYLINYSKKLNIIRISKEQSSLYNWPESFDRTTEWINRINPATADFPVLFPIWLAGAIFKEKFDHKKFNINYFCYYLLSNARYKLLRSRLPYHVDWHQKKI